MAVPDQEYVYALVTTARSRQVQYIRFTKRGEKLDQAFTRPFAEAWQGSPETLRWISQAASSGKSIPALYLPKTGRLYLFNTSTYVRCTLATHTVDGGYPRKIADGWPGMTALDFDSGIDSALWWGEKTAYFFKGDTYVRYNLEADTVDNGYPRKIADGWNGLKAAGFDRGIDAFIRWDDNKAHALKGDQYIRFDIPTDKTDQNPRTTVA